MNPVTNLADYKRREVELRRVLGHAKSRMETAPTGRQRDAWRVFKAHVEFMIKEIEQ